MTKKRGKERREVKKLGRAQLIIATEARNGGKAETKRKENQSGIEKEREREREVRDRRRRGWR